MPACLKAKGPRPVPPPPKPLGEPIKNGSSFPPPSPLTGPLIWKRGGGQINFSLGDNSDTPISLLALWCAPRPDIPGDLALVGRYPPVVYIQTQDAGGGY